MAGDTEASGAALLAERMRHAVANAPIVVDAFAGTATLSITVSAGWATARDALALDALVQAADHALYAAKSAGRNCVRGAAPDPR